MLLSTDQQLLHMIGEDTYDLGRIALRPGACPPIQTDAKSVKIVISMAAARLKCDEVLQCMVFRTGVLH